MSHRWVLPTAIALTLAIGVPAAGAEEPADVPDGMEWSPTKGLIKDPLKVDARLFAKDSGRPFDEVLAQLRTQESLDDKLAGLDATDPDYANGYWQDGELYIQFKGDVPKGVVAEARAIAASPVHGKSVKYSMRDLEDMQAKINAGLRTANVKDWATAIDPKSQRIVATVQATGTAKKEAVRADLAARAPDGVLSLSFTPSEVNRDYYTYGSVDANRNGNFACTTGFSVKQGSTSGTTTAGHCKSGIDESWDWHQDKDHALTYQNGFEGNWGDFQWLTSAGNCPDDFYRTNGGSRRDVNGVKNSFVVGEKISGFGRGRDNPPAIWPHTGTGGFQATVKFLNKWAPDGVGKLNCFNYDPGEPGDSGGPVYDGRLAAGFIKGPVSLGNPAKNRLCFSQARYIDDAIGVSIKQ